MATEVEIKLSWMTNFGVHNGTCLFIDGKGVDQIHEHNKTIEYYSDLKDS